MPTKGEKDSVTGTETTGHEWDGIKELNTPLPRWWLWVFYVTIIWSVVYWVLYPAIPTLSGYTRGLIGYNQREELQEQLAAAQEQRAGFMTGIRDSGLHQILDDPELLSVAFMGGRAAFADNCAPCHGLGGAGQRGYPSLADDEWLWGGSLDEIHFTLLHGIRADNDQSRISEMPAFGALGMLGRAEIADVAQHILDYTGRATDAAAAERGAAVFAAQCASCHGEDGGGNIELGAPALNDEIWLFGGERAEIIAQIHQPKHGVMPAWDNRLDDTTIKMLTVYVHSLGGGQ
jgi:cytochrome c oxidase cbb3-type subunit 3